MGSTRCSIIGGTATAAATDGEFVACSWIGGACNSSDGCKWIDGASGDSASLGSAVRSQYQNTNPAIDRRTTSSSSTTGMSKPPGRTSCLASSRFSVARGTTNRSLVVAIARQRSGPGAGIGICICAIDKAIGTAAGCANLGTLATLGDLSSGNAPAGTFAAVRIPLNRPAHPRQYFARSRFAVWQDSQNFVMTMEAGRATHGIGMYAVITTSKLITTEKAAKSISDARSGIPSRCHGKTASRKRRPSVLSLGAV